MTYFSIAKKKCRTNFIRFRPLFVRTALSFFVCLLLLVLIVYPELCASSFTTGLLLFSTSVLPCLFPFLFLTKMLTDLGMVEKATKFFNKPFKFLFGTNGLSFYLFIMSLVCGYPVGAKILSDLVMSKRITKAEAERMLPFCTSSGILFIVGTVGASMFFDKTLGLMLFLVHFLSVFTTALIVCNAKRIFKKSASTKLIAATQKPPAPLDSILSKSMTDSCASILTIGGFISIFYLVIDILTKFKILAPISAIFSCLLKAFGANPSISAGIAAGLVEMTRGCKELSQFGSPTTAIAVSGILAFGGLSVIIQSISFLSKARISSLKFVGIKLIQAAFAVLFAILVIK